MFVDIRTIEMGKCYGRLPIADPYLAMKHADSVKYPRQSHGSVDSYASFANHFPNLPSHAPSLTYLLFHNSPPARLAQWSRSCFTRRTLIPASIPAEVPTSNH